MTRKMFETEIDLENEENIKVFLQKIWKCKLKKLPNNYHIDFLAVKDGAPRAWVEVRCRSHKFGYYDDFIISLNKIKDGREYAIMTGYTFILVVHWQDTLRWCRIDTINKFTVDVGGRTQATLRDCYDIEPVIRIPLSCFRSFA